LSRNVASMVKGQKEGSSTLDPMFCGLLWSELEVDFHHVGGFGHITLSLWIVVARALVDVGLGFRSLDDRLEPDDWHQHLQFHHLWFDKVQLVHVPLGSFEEETVDVCTFFHFCHDFRNETSVRLEIELKSID